MARKRWTIEDIEWLKSLQPSHTWNETSEIMGRSRRSVYNKCMRLKLKRPLKQRNEMISRGMRRFYEKHGYNTDPLFYLTIRNYRKTHPTCELCGFIEVIDIHHIDRDNKNNKPENLISLCPNHHRLVHMGKTKIERPYCYFSTAKLEIGRP